MTEEFKEEFYKKAEIVSSIEDISNLFSALKENSEDLDVSSYTECVGHLITSAIKYLFSKEASQHSKDLEAPEYSQYLFWYMTRSLFDREGPMQILEFDDMLYPFFEHNFDRVITENTKMYLMQKAKDLLNSGVPVTKEVKEHWEFIADGGIPFGYILKD